MYICVEHTHIHTEIWEVKKRQRHQERETERQRETERDRERQKEREMNGIYSEAPGLGVVLETLEGAVLGPTAHTIIQRMKLGDDDVRE
jgi:hypothetical protein